MSEKEENPTAVAAIQRCEVVYPGYQVRCLREKGHTEMHLGSPVLTGKRGILEWEGPHEGARVKMLWEYERMPENAPAFVVDKQYKVLGLMVGGVVRPLISHALTVPPSPQPHRMGEIGGNRVCFDCSIAVIQDAGAPFIQE
jgi:hypothetical protein